VKELRIQASAGAPISRSAVAFISRSAVAFISRRSIAFTSRITVGLHEPCQAAIALLLEEQRAMLLATEIAQRQLPEYRQLISANQAIHASSKYPQQNSPVLLQIVENLPPNLLGFKSPSFYIGSTKLLNPF
jgi:hypothetical protein